MTKATDSNAQCPAQPGVLIRRRRWLCGLTAAGFLFSAFRVEAGSIDPEPCGTITVPTGTVIKRQLVEIKGQTVREPLGRVKTSHRRPCRAAEDDEQCQQRVAAEAERAGASADEVTVVIEGPPGGILSVFEIDGRVVRRRFASFEAAADFFKARTREGKRITMLSAKRQKEASKRRAWVRVQTMRTRQLPNSTVLRLTWRPGVDSTKAAGLIQSDSRRSSRIVRFEVLAGGVIELDFSCKTVR